MISAFFVSNTHVQTSGREPRWHSEAPTRRRCGSIHRRGSDDVAPDEVVRRNVLKLAYDL